jgi:HPt (histidine-containing phosphotransfer) domain-containing protein
LISSSKPTAHSTRWMRTCAYLPSPSAYGWRTHVRTQADSVSNSEKKDLAQLSALGHFLKGSSATLGLTKVKDHCEKIQHYGAHKDETGTRDEPDVDVCIDNLKVSIAQAKKEFKVVERLLRRFYHDDDE